MLMNIKNIHAGLELESPSVLIPWELTEEEELKNLVNPQMVNSHNDVTYYNIEAEEFNERIKMIVYFEYVNGKLKSIYIILREKILKKLVWNHLKKSKKSYIKYLDQLICLIILRKSINGILGK